MKRVYLYLAKRDKKGIKVLAVLKGHDCPPGRLADLKKLMLPPALEQQIEQKIHEDRMLWEPWLESAESFADLKKSLKDRGYKSLPLCSSPIFSPEKESVITDRGQMKYMPVVKPVVPQVKTMIRKNKG
jgi:hypothetical protein